MSHMYRGLYEEADRCSRQQTTVADKCRNLKMFSEELDRLYQLVLLQVKAKLPF